MKNIKEQQLGEEIEKLMVRALDVYDKETEERREHCIFGMRWGIKLAAEYLYKTEQEIEESIKKAGLYRLYTSLYD